MSTCTRMSKGIRKTKGGCNPCTPLHAHLARLPQVVCRRTASFASAKKTAIRKFACQSESDARSERWPVFLIVASTCLCILSYRIVGGVCRQGRKSGFLTFGLQSRECECDLRPDDTSRPRDQASERQRDRERKHTPSPAAIHPGTPAETGKVPPCTSY